MNGQNFATIVARQSCRLVCRMDKCLLGCGGTYGNGCKGIHCQSFTTKVANFKAGVILIACKVWAKRGGAVCLPNMGGVGSTLFFDQVEDQLSDFTTNDKEEFFKYITFIRKGTHISNYVVWRFMEDGKEADSVQRRIIRRILSIKMKDNGIGRHFVQCATRSREKRMISPKIPELFLTLAKSSKVPFVRDNIKILTSQEWAVIEKEVRSENGKNGYEAAVRSIAVQMELKTGQGNQGAVRSVAKQMELKTGEMPSLEAAASEMGSICGRKSVGKPKGNAIWAKVVQRYGKVADTKSKFAAELCHQKLACRIEFAIQTLTLLRCCLRA